MMLQLLTNAPGQEPFDSIVINVMTEADEVTCTPHELNPEHAEINIHEGVFHLKLILSQANLALLREALEPEE